MTTESLACKQDKAAHERLLSILNERFEYHSSEEKSDSTTTHHTIYIGAETQLGSVPSFSPALSTPRDESLSNYFFVNKEVSPASRESSFGF